MTAFHNNLGRVTVLLSVLIILAFVLSAWSVYTSHKSSCQARDVTLTVMADLLVAAQHQTDSDPTVTPVKKAESDRFVAEALTTIHSNSC